jgi:hypothetical protein
MNSTGTVRSLVITVTLAIAVFAWFGVLGCNSGQGTSPPEHVKVEIAAQDSTYAITHVTVIDPARGSVEQRDMAIVIRGNRIVSVGPTVSIDIPPGAVIARRLRPLHVIPGLWDAHVHLSQVGPNAFPLFIANGITSVRDMGSDFAQVSRWKAARAAGALMPRIITPGPKLDGGSFLEPMLTSGNHERRILTSPADARSTIDALKAQGVDFIKVHNNLSPAVYDAIVAECRKDHLAFAGHLPMAGPLAAAAAGQRTIEHGRGMLLCSPSTWRRIRSDP